MLLHPFLGARTSQGHAPSFTFVWETLSKVIGFAMRRRPLRAAAVVALERPLGGGLNDEEEDEDSEDESFEPGEEGDEDEEGAGDSNDRADRRVVDTGAVDALWAEMRSSAKTKSASSSTAPTATGVASAPSQASPAEMETKGGNETATPAAAASGSAPKSAVELLWEQMKSGSSTSSAPSEDTSAASTSAPGSSDAVADVGDVRAPETAVEQPTRKRAPSLAERIAEASRTQKRAKSSVAASAEKWEQHKHDHISSSDALDASKAGYLEKQSLLSRLDQRSFEAERRERELERARRAHRAMQGDFR
jgi:Bucentaur or craniofacial development